MSEVLTEDGLNNVTIERDTGLGVEVELLLRNVNHVVLCGIAETIDDLHGQRLLVGETLDSFLGHTLTHAFVEADRFFLSGFPNSTALVQNRGFQKQLKRSVEENEHDFLTASIPGRIEPLDG